MVRESLIIFNYPFGIRMTFLIATTIYINPKRDVYARNQRNLRIALIVA